MMKSITKEKLIKAQHGAEMLVNDLIDVTQHSSGDAVLYELCMDLIAQAKALNAKLYRITRE